MSSFSNYSFYDNSIQAGSTMEVDNPYASVSKLPKSSPRELKPTVYSGVAQSTVSTRITRRKQSHKPTEIAKAATGKIVFKQKTCKADKHPNEDYGTFDPNRQLYEDPTLATLKTDGTKQFWFFILSLLMDSSKKDVISWTGNGKEFAVTDKATLSSLWSRCQNYSKTVQADSIRRNFAACYKKRVMMPVKAQQARYAFITEPSLHVGMSVEELSIFIATNSKNGSTSSNKNKATMKVEDPIYHTPPHSSIDELNEFFCTPVSAERMLDNVAPPTSAYPEASAFFNAELAQPLPIINFNQTNYSFDPYWNVPTPFLPAFVNPLQNQFFPACMRDYDNFPRCQGNNNN